MNKTKIIKWFFNNNKNKALRVSNYFFCGYHEAIIVLCRSDGDHHF